MRGGYLAGTTQHRHETQRLGGLFARLVEALALDVDLGRADQREAEAMLGIGRAQRRGRAREFVRCARFVARQPADRLQGAGASLPSRSFSDSATSSSHQVSAAR